MSGKFMTVRRIMLPVMAAIILISQLTGCAAMTSNEMVDMIDQGQTIVLEVNQPSVYASKMQGEQKQDVTWVMLDQLKTFNMGFRQGVDELFNINTITDAAQGKVGGKQGSLFVVKVDGQEMRSGNTTIKDAFRNKSFVTKYWESADVQSKLAELSEQAYTDVDRNSPYAVEATLNAYFNLLTDAENPDSFNPTQSVSREAFYTLVFKSSESVKDLGYFASTDSFATAVGGDTEYTMYAKEVADLGFLPTENKSLDSTNIGTSISRVEAVYMLVMQNFSELMANTTAQSRAFKDTKSAGDLALKAGFKEEVKKERVNSETNKVEKYKEVVDKERWQAYTLAYMFKNPEKGMQDELYRAMAVAKQVGIIEESESRWDESLSKSEAIDLIISTQLAKNKTDGYLTEVEYASIEAPLSYGQKDGYEVIVDGIDIDQVIADTSNIGLGDLKESQLSIFQDTAKKYVDEVKNGASTVGEVDDKQDSLIVALVTENVLPINGVSLFSEWKHTNGYYDQFTQSEPAPEVSKPAPEKPVETQKPAETSKPAPQSTPPAPEPPKPAPPVQTNKPKPSPEQKVEQTTPPPASSGPITVAPAKPGDDADLWEKEHGIEIGGIDFEDAQPYFDPNDFK